MMEQIKLAEDRHSLSDKNKIYGRKNDLIQIVNVYKGFGNKFFYLIKNLDKPADFPPFDVPETALKKA